jgi:hypothetical protein
MAGNYVQKSYENIRKNPTHNLFYMWISFYWLYNIYSHVARSIKKRMVSMKSIKEKMLESNKARTDLLADNPEINSKWTPNALEIMKAKKAEKIDFKKDSEYIRMYGKKEGEMFNYKGVKMKDMINQLLENKSLTVFLGIVIVALVFGWLGG